MEHSLAFDEGFEGAQLPEGYELERQRSITLRRYAEAREASRLAHEEYRACESQADARAELIEAARLKFEAAAARCVRLRNILVDIEERLFV
jgi:hypothetical protein